MAKVKKVSKNQQTDRRVQEGSKDNVKVIVAFKTKNGTCRFKETVLHKDKLPAFIEANSQLG